MSKVDHGQDLYQLVYASRAVLPNLANFDSTVDDILATARPNNQRLGLSGMLLAHKGWFLQTLEGPRRNVSQVFGIIGRDLRHVQLEILGSGVIQRRAFGDWAMCGGKITPAAAPILRALDVAADFDPFQMDGAKATELLSAISRLPSVHWPVKAAAPQARAS